MSLVVLIPLSIGMGLLGLAAFIWALRHDQFDDPKGNASRVLLNDKPPAMKGRTHERLASNTADKNA